MSEKTSTKLKQVLHLCVHLVMNRYYTESMVALRANISYPAFARHFVPLQLETGRLDHLISV